MAGALGNIEPLDAIVEMHGARPMPPRVRGPASQHYFIYAGRDLICAGAFDFEELVEPGARATKTLVPGVKAAFSAGENRSDRTVLIL